MLNDLMMILSFADSVVKNDAAWNALYEDMKSKHPEDALGSQEARDMIHKTIHSVGEGVNLVTMLGKLNLDGAQIAGVQVVPMPEQAPKPEARPKAEADELDAMLQRQYL